MSRPAPKFAVGDEVIVLASHGHFNAVITRVGWYNNPELFSGETPGAGWGYWVEPDRPPLGHSWPEWCLQKKPRPDHIAADQSFDQLMQGLKRPQGVEA